MNPFDNQLHFNNDKYQQEVIQKNYVNTINDRDNFNVSSTNAKNNWQQILLSEMVNK